MRAESKRGFILTVRWSDGVSVKRDGYKSATEARAEVRGEIDAASCWGDALPQVTAYTIVPASPMP